MFLIAVAFFVPTICAAPIAGYFSHLIRPLWLTALLALISAATVCLLILATPFHGWITELPLGIMVLLALAPAMAAFMQIERRARDRLDQKRALPPLLFAVVLFVLISLAFIEVPWTSRISYAERVAWACDGTIVKKYSSNNHDAPSLIIQTPEGRVSLEAVDEEFFKRVKIGEHLSKRGGSVLGKLDGENVRVVPRTMPWWNEPKQTAENSKNSCARTANCAGMSSSRHANQRLDRVIEAGAA